MNNNKRTISREYVADSVPQTITTSTATNKHTLKAVVPHIRYRDEQQSPQERTFLLERAQQKRKRKQHNRPS